MYMTNRDISQGISKVVKFERPPKHFTTVDEIITALQKRDISMTVYKTEQGVTMIKIDYKGNTVDDANFRLLLEQLHIKPEQYE